MLEFAQFVSYHTYANEAWARLDSFTGYRDERQEALVALREPVSREAGGSSRQGRRLSDKILVAFHHACDVDDFVVADCLLRTLELMLGRRPLPADLGRRRSIESFVAAHERLWHLRHPDVGD